jgi:hypothetical protein
MLAILVDRRFLPLLLIGLAFTHTRFLVYCAAIVFAWIGIECIHKNHFKGLTSSKGGDKGGRKIKKLFVFYSVVAVIALIISFIAVKIGVLQCNVHSPVFLTELATNRELTMEYIARWYPAMLSAVGMVVAVFRRDKRDRFVFAWIIGILALVILVDTGVLNLHIEPNRAFTELYIPLSILAAYPVYAVERYLTDSADNNAPNRNRKQMKVVLVLAILLLLIGGVSTGVVFKSYVGPWALPEADYQAMVWMNEQRFENGICINIDSVGRWVYPLTGIPVSDPRCVPRPDVTRGWPVIRNPNDPKTLEKLYSDSLRYEPVLLYVSNVTNSRPGHIPPFTIFYEYYPKVNVSNFNATHYDLIYARDGAYILEYKAP